jgi:hypothetical protein
MKKYIFTLVIGCIALLMAVSCHRQSKNLPVYDLDADSLIDRHFNYKPGSYWVYRDSLNGRVDSFFVRSNYYVKQQQAYGIYNYHYITIIEYNVDGSKPSDSASWVYNYKGNKVILDYQYGRNGYGWKNDITYEPLFLYPFLYGDNYSSNDTTRVIGIDSVYYVSGQPYNVVAHVQHFNHLALADVSHSLTYIDDRFDVNDSIGIVKMKIFHPYDTVNHVWELQRFNVIK